MNWLSVHIYHKSSFETILIEHIKPIVEVLKNEKYIHNMFYIRYWEKGPHIRLRLATTDVIPLATLKSIVKEKITISLETKKIRDYSIEFIDYVQELERYGGKTAIHIAESNFIHSSQVTLNVIEENYKHWDYSMALSNAMKINLILIKSVFKTFEASIPFLKTIYINWFQHSIKMKEENTIDPLEVKKVQLFFDASYNKQKNTVQQLIKDIWQENYLNNNLNEWATFTTQLAKDIKALADKKAINFPTSINLNGFINVDTKNIPTYLLLDSYIHMTNNRLGIFLRDESFIAYLLFKSLEDVVTTHK